MEIKENYKMFVSKLENYMIGKKVKDLKSHDIIKDFLLTKLQLYEGIEITMQGICCAVVKISVESVVESLVSRYEVHFDKTRQLMEEHALQEMEIAENGPILARADSVIESAMNAYWNDSTDKGLWHFIRSEHDIASFGDQEGKTITRLKKEKSRFPFMDK